MRQHFIWQDFVNANLVLTENRYNPLTKKVEQVEYINSNVLFAIQSKLKRRGISFHIPGNILRGRKITREEYVKSFNLIVESRGVFSNQPLDREYHKCLGEVGPFDI